MKMRLLLTIGVIPMTLITVALLRPTTGSAQDSPVMPVIRWPPGSEHVFAKPDAAWTKTMSRLKPRSDGFEVIAIAGADQKTDGDWTQAEYRAQEDHGPNNWHKMQRWDSDGRLRLEIDKNGDDSFFREFYKNGTLAVYEHRRGDKLMPKWVGAVSFDSNGKEVARVENGSGELIRRSREQDEYYLIRGGEARFFKASKDGKICSVQLQAGSDVLTINLGEGYEGLYLSGEPDQNGHFTSTESWSKSRGGVPALADIQFIDPETGATESTSLNEKTMSRRRELMGDGNGSSFNTERERQRIANESAERAKLRVSEYAKARAAFLERYTKYLNEIGTDLKKLGVEDLVKPD